MPIIETPGEQDKAELLDDRTYVFGVLQMTCAKGRAYHIVNRYEMYVNSFAAQLLRFKGEEGVFAPKIVLVDALSPMLMKELVPGYATRNATVYHSIT